MQVTEISSLKYESVSVTLESVSMTLSIPMHPLLFFVKSQDIAEMERKFIEYRDRTSDHARKVELDRARALMKYAHSCNARLLNTFFVDKKVKFTLEFDTYSEMSRFEKNVNGAIASATMT